MNTLIPAGRYCEIYDENAESVAGVNDGLMLLYAAPIKAFVCVYVGVGVELAAPTAALRLW